MEFIAKNYQSIIIAVSAIILLNVIGNGFIFRLIKNLIRGAFYLVVFYIFFYLIKNHWPDVVLHGKKIVAEMDKMLDIFIWLTEGLPWKINQYCLRLLIL